MQPNQPLFDDHGNRPNHVPAAGGFDVPEGYFEKLSSKMKMLPQEQKQTNGKFRMFLNGWMGWSVAAAVITIVGLSAIVNAPGEISNQDLAFLIIDDELIVDDELILETFIESKVSFDQGLIDDDPTIEYLLDYPSETIDFIYEL